MAEGKTDLRMANVKATIVSLENLFSRWPLGTGKFSALDENIVRERSEKDAPYFRYDRTFLV
jgi:hypothetical protein